jgi:tungstate transport system substrate-binding protein
VRIVAVGTGQALRNAKKCDAELVIVHSKIDEEKFVTDGFGSQRHDLMYNDFILVGPKNDPAQIGTAKTIIEAFQKIAAAKARFASRSDDSGTHKAERRFWQAARTTPTDASGKWYLETGLGMGATLNFAVQADAYALTDRATWLTFKNKTTHMPLFQGDPALFNQYGVVLVSQIHCPTIKAAESRIFANWLLSPKGQTAIATFQHENRPLFFPNATP